MSESDPRMPPDRPSATGPWQAGVPASPSGEPVVPTDSPTVLSGSGSGSGSRSTVPGPDVRGGPGLASRPDLVPPLPMPGDRMDAYVVEAAIGVGGMGAVYRAHDDQLDRTVALKILPPEQARDAESVRRFYQEGRSAARLDHDNIARVFTIGHASPHHYIAFEFIEGETLRQRVDRGGALSVGDAIDTTLQIALALVHAAERGVVHRDVKPSNIIVTPQGRAKLVDMGLARRFERGGDAGLTQTGMTLGTFDYISPEQARDPRDVDVRSDLYSLGCTLYYMLAGRPPFPDGTVLQKLLQHQEEPPPDVRAANPEVPPALAAIVVKLMAKDRDRRYQTPDQLVADLEKLALALDPSAYGLKRPVHPAPAPPSGWARRLTWAVSGLAAAIFLAIMIRNWPTGAARPPAPPRTDVVAQPPPGTPPATDRAAPVAVGKADGARPVGPVRPPADRVVRKTEDLIRLLTDSAPGTTFLLEDDGPYDLRPGPGPITVRDVTIRAGIGVQPVVRLARDTASSRTAPALLDLRGGRLAIDGLEFQVDSDDRKAPLAAVRVEGTELTLARCIVRRVGTRPGLGRTAGLHLLAATGPDREELGEVVVDSCHFEGGQYAVLAEGPVELTVRDVTFGGARSATICSANADRAGRPATLRFNHASVLLGDAPFLRSTGVPPHVRMKESAIGPAAGIGGMLVASDDPARVDWQGRDNVYSGIGVFLADLRSPAGFAPVKQFDAWADDPLNVREADSIVSPGRIWAVSDPSLLLAGNPNDPSGAFRLATIRGLGGRVGVRRGPLGALTASSRLASGFAEIRPDRGESVRPPATAPPTLARAEIPASSVGPPRRTTPEIVEPMPREEDLGEDMPPEMPPTPVPVGVGIGARPASGGQVEKVASSAPIAPKGAPPSRTDAPVAVAREPEGRLIRSPAQLADALVQAGGRGETLRLISDADWEMSSCQLRATGFWTIQAEPGKARPKIRFRPKVDESRPSRPWAAWLSLLSGSLHLEGLDLVLPREDAPRGGRWAAFSVAAGTELSVKNCTVTIEGTDVPSSVIVAASAHAMQGPGDAEPDPLTATVRLRDSFFRGGGDLIDVAGDRRVDLQVDNAVVASGGSLLHGHGRPRPQFVDPMKEKETLLKATLRRLTARAERGLVRLESTADAPELPVAEVVARDSVFSTDGKGAPMILIDGQDDPELLRDQVRWDGHGVAYHRITNYRRDQDLRAGEAPSYFERPAWDVAVGHHESDPIHGDAEFVSEWPARRPAWAARPEDLRLKPEGPAAKVGAGSDLDLIPKPPPVRS